MNDIRFEQVIFQQQNKDEISEVVKSYKILMSKCSSDTMFQLTHNDLLSKGYELYDYIANDDISPTTFDKLKEFINQVTEEINSGDYQLLKETAEIVAKAKKKQKLSSDINTDLHKRLEEAADNFIGHPYEIDEGVDITCMRNAFKEGAEFGYKEAIEVAKEWLKNQFDD